MHSKTDRTEGGAGRLWSRREVLAAGALLLLEGCAAEQGSGTPQSGQPSAGGDGENVVSLLMPGDADEDACARAAERLSERTRETLGFAVQIEQAPREEYEATLWQRIMREETADVFYLPAEQSLGMPIYQDCLFPLTSRLKRYEGLYGAFSEAQWDSRRYFRIIYAVPARTNECYRLGFYARTEVLEALGIDPAGVRTMDELYGVLTQVKQAYPEMTPVVSDCGCVLPCLEQDPLNDGLGVLPGNRGTTVVNWYASEEYAALCRRMYQWAQEGLILREGCLRTEPAGSLLEVYDGFGYFAKLCAGDPGKRILDGGAELTAIPLGPLLQNSSGAADSWALPVHESNKEGALALLELLYTDETAARRFAGEEAETDGADGDGSLWKNEAVSYADLRPSAAEAERVSPAYGFVFNEMNWVTKISACESVVEQYHNALMCGYLNPAEALPLFVQALEEAGIGEIVENKQRQLDDWLDARQ